MNNLSKGASFLTISSFFFLISGYAVNIFLGRYLGPELYGVYGIIISLMALVNLLQMSGLPQAVSKSLSEDSKNKDAIFRTGFMAQLNLSLTIGLLYFLFAYPIAYLLKDDSLIPYIQLSSLIFPLYGVYAMYTGYYNGLQNFKKQTVIIIAYSFFKSLFVIILAIYLKIYGIIIAFILAPLFAVIFGDRIPFFQKSNFSYSKLLKLAFPLISFATILMLLQSVDIFFIKAMLNDKESVGYYTASQNISKIIYFSLNAFSIVLFPSIAKHHALDETVKIRSLIHKSLRIMMIILIPATLLISFTSKDIITLLYTTDYLPAKESLSILIYSFSFLTIFTMFGNILNGAGEQHKSVLISIIALICTIILCVFLVPKYGLIGGAIASTVGSIIAMCVSARYVYKKFNALISIKSMINILIASLIITYISSFNFMPIYLLPLWYLLLFLLYLGFLILIKEITEKDIRLIKDLLLSFRSNKS